MVVNFFLRISSKYTTMNESTVMFDCSEFISLNDKKTGDFYNNLRLAIAEIVADLDETWATVRNTEPHNERLHAFKLLSLDDFIIQEKQRRAPQPTAASVAKSTPRSVTKASIPVKRPLIKADPPSIETYTRAPLSTRSSPGLTKKATGPPASPRPKPRPKQSKWIRVEDIHVPL